MDAIEETRGARIIVETTADVKAGESVLIVGDWKTVDVAKHVAAAARERDAEVTVVLMEPREHDGNSPPESVGAAVLEADVIIMPVSRSITHSPEVQTALEEGVRVVSMVQFTEEMLTGGGLFADFEAMQPHCEELARRLTNADEAVLSSPHGTDAVFRLTDRSGNAHSGIVDEPGQFTGAGNIEANVAPVEGKTEGQLVFDGAIPNLDIGLVDEPIVVEVDDGAVTSIEGGQAAETIATVWNKHDDPAVYNIAQLAVGMNPEYRDFDGSWRNAHACYGTVHVGIGTSSTLGGTTQAPVHFDATMKQPTLKLDGETVLEEGEFTFF